jgi:hypothetical protein
MFLVELSLHVMHFPISADSDVEFVYITVELHLAVASETIVAYV